MAGNKKTIIDKDWLGRKVVRVIHEDGTEAKHVHDKDWLGREVTRSEVVSGRDAGKTWKKTKDKDWLGRNTTRAEYDNGREVKHTSDRDWLGRKVIKTEEVRRGTKKCFKCGREVSPSYDGTYSCCGRTWR